MSAFVRISWESPQSFGGNVDPNFIPTVTGLGIKVLGGRAQIVKTLTEHRPTVDSLICGPCGEGGHCGGARPEVGTPPKME